MQNLLKVRYTGQERKTMPYLPQKKKGSGKNCIVPCDRVDLDPSTK